MPGPSPKPRCGKDLPSARLSPALGWRLWMSLGLVLAHVTPVLALCPRGSAQRGRALTKLCWGGAAIPSCLLPAGTEGLSGLGCPGRGPSSSTRAIPAAVTCSESNHTLQCVPGGSCCPSQAWRRPTAPVMGKNGARDGSGPSRSMDGVWILVWILGHLGQGSSCFLEENLVWILQDPPCWQCCRVWVQLNQSGEFSPS